MNKPTLNETENLSKYYSINELTALGLGSRSKINRLAKKGVLVAVKIGGSVRFSADEVKRYINACNA